VKSSGPEHRSSRLTVHELRQFLREADEDRFQLAAALRDCRARASSMNGGTLIAVILVAAGLGSSAWTANAPVHSPIQQVNAPLKTPKYVRAASTLAENASDSSRRAPAQRFATASMSKAPLRHRRSTTSVRPSAPQMLVGKPAPRPLHPGEFGRTSEELARIFAERTSPRTIRKS
jgi:hypothetical protein